MFTHAPCLNYLCAKIRHTPEKMNRYTKPTLQKLEQVFKELDYLVRYEKGHFNSGYCIVENTKVVVINKFFETDARVSVLLEILDKVMAGDEILTDKSKSFLRNLLRSKDQQQEEPHESESKASQD